MLSDAFVSPHSRSAIQGTSRTLVSRATIRILIRVPKDISPLKNPRNRALGLYLLIWLDTLVLHQTLARPRVDYQKYEFQHLGHLGTGLKMRQMGHLVGVSYSNILFVKFCYKRGIQSLFYLSSLLYIQASSQQRDVLQHDSVPSSFKDCSYQQEYLHIGLLG